MREFKYSKQKFDGHTHRAMVEVLADGKRFTVNIYTNNPQKENVEYQLSQKVSIPFDRLSVIHFASKEQDDLTAEFIEEWLKTF